MRLAKAWQGLGPIHFRRPDQTIPTNLAAGSKQDMGPTVPWNLQIILSKPSRAAHLRRKSKETGPIAGPGQLLCQTFGYELQSKVEHRALNA